MKKLVALLLAALMVFSLAACGSKDDGKWPKGDISIVVPFKAGGAMDLSARLTAQYLKKYLGVEVTVDNVEGGANWTGYRKILDAKGDGYLLGFANYPGQVGGYLDPSKGRKETYRDFCNIANIVHDPGIIVVKEDSPYQSLAELLAAAKAGTKMTISTGGGAGSDDDVLVRLIASKMGISTDVLIPGDNENDSEAKNLLLNGECDARACNLSNYYNTYTTKGQPDSVRVLAVFDANKQELMPDVATIDELNIPELKGLYSSSDRGLVACKDLDPAVIEIIVDALKKTNDAAEFQADAKKQGMGINMLFGDDFTKYIDNWEQTLKGMAKDFGWE